MNVNDSRTVFHLTNFCIRVFNKNKSTKPKQTQPYPTWVNLTYPSLKSPIITASGLCARFWLVICLVWSPGPAQSVAPWSAQVFSMAPAPDKSRCCESVCAGRWGGGDVVGQATCAVSWCAATPHPTPLSWPAVAPLQLLPEASWPAGSGFSVWQLQ